MIAARYASALPVACCLAAVISLWPSASCTAGDYTLSAHGNTSTGVSRLGLNTRTTIIDYSTGNCAHCHEQHASVIGSEPTPTGGPGNYLGMANETGVTNAEQTLCFYCHGTTAGNNESSGTNDDIKTDIDNIAVKPYRHTLTLSETAHRPTETLADIAAAKHVECTDCHNPHAAGHTKHTKGIVGGNAIVTNSSPLYKATGIVPTYTGIDPNWGNNTIEYGSYSAIQAVDKEYQICFKCHTRANLNVESWGTTPPASYAWTDVGMEFNPLNKSHHPVVSALTGSGSSKLTATQLSTPWAANAGTQTMYCTDCHESDSTIAGPHGSATKWILAGTNKAWPYTLKSKNGRNDTTVYRTLDTMESDLGTEEGLFCRNCHPNTKSSSINSAHSRTNHTTTKCVDCHIRIPHGGRVSRLIAADNSDTYTMPARYTSDGAGLNTGGTNVPYVKEFIKAASGAGYNAVNCTTSSGCTGGSGHTTTSNGGEEW